MFGLLSAWRDWSERREILRALRRQKADSDERERFKVQDELTYALSALERNDRKFATETWERLMERHPALAHESPLALRVLMGLRRFDEAEALMRAGQKKHPSDPRFAMGFAEVAHTRGDFKTAIERWALVRKRFPGVVQGYTRAANALNEQAQSQSAEALVVQATKQFPDDIGGPLEYARIAVKRGDWEEALRRWQPVREKFGYLGGFIGAAEALSHLGRYDEAEELLQVARYRFGTEPAPLSEFARLAEAKGDIAEAVRRWKGVVERFPLDVIVYSVASEAFERLGDPAEAEATLRAAIERMPTEMRPMLELAKLFHFRRRDFAAAAEAWAAMRRSFPDFEEAYTSAVDALVRIGRTDAAKALREEHVRRFTPD